MKKRNVSIQLLRVCACLLVFLVHFGQRMNFSGVLRTLTDFGTFGVQIFFLISGFLAASTFFGNSNVNILNYYIKRMIAILPLYYFVILYYFVTENVLNHFFPVIPPDELGLGWIRYIFLLNGFLNSKETFWQNLGATWTIPIFMFFYLIAPWILRKMKTVFSSVVVWGVIFVVSQIIKLFYNCSILSNLHLLFLGVVVYACVKKERTTPALIVFLIAAMGLSIVGITRYVYIFIFCGILIVMTGLDTLPLPQWLYNIINVLDQYSYTLYLMHAVVFCSILDRLHIWGVSIIVLAVVAIVGSFVATFLVGKFIEKPVQEFLKKKFLKA